MSTPDWQQEFSTPTHDIHLLLKELAEKAYQEGNVERLESIARYLLKIGLCENTLLRKLSEAALKTERPLLACFALELLIDEEPDVFEYRVHFANSLASLAKYKEALAVVENFSPQPEDINQYNRIKDDLLVKLDGYSEFLILLDKLEEKVSASQCSEVQIMEDAELLLKSALVFSDKSSVVKIICVVLKKINLPESYMVDACFSLKTPETSQYMDRLILSISSIHRYPDLLRKYLAWKEVNEKSIPHKEIYNKLMRSDAKSDERWSDVVAVLCALNNDWHLFAKLLDKAWLQPERLPVLVKYSALYWHKHEQKKFKLLLDNFESLSQEEISHLCDALSSFWELAETRLKIADYSLAKEGVVKNVYAIKGGALTKANNNTEAVNCLFEAFKADSCNAIYALALSTCLHKIGDRAQALSYCKLALSLDPEGVYVWRQLAYLYSHNSEWRNAYGALRIWLSRNVKDAEAWSDYFETTTHLNLLSEGRRALNKLLKLKPKWHKVLFDCCTFEYRCGNVDKAIEYAFKILNNKSNPKELRVRALSSVVFGGNYSPNVTSEKLSSWYRRVNEFLPKPVYEPSVTSWENRKVRIGYVSSDLKIHPVSTFLEALFKNHDKSRFEIFAYSGSGMEDRITEIFKRDIDVWRDVHTVNANDLAKMIHDDQIDVLVDLHGHTSGHRLEVFAMRPCAVQVTWLGFAHTTGMNEMDYILGDEQLTPVGSDENFSEKPWRLPRASYCYTPHLHWRETVPAIDVREKGAPIVFGNLGRAVRFNKKVLKVWKRLLDEVPNSILKIGNPNFQDKEAREMMYGRFQSAGISRERLWIGHVPNYIETIQSIDIALDGFPQNSGTTLFEFLWCGVPIVTKKDRPSVGRLGAMILHGVNHDEWIAENEDEYIEIAKKLASDPERLYEIRKSLREEFIGSELCDGKGFAKAVEDAYFGMLKEKSGNEAVESKMVDSSEVEQTDESKELLEESTFAPDKLIADGSFPKSILQLVSRQVEVAYEQGDVERLGSSVTFLMNYGVAKELHLKQLAEAGLKAQRPDLAEVALQELVRLNPEQPELLLHLSDAQSAQNSHQQAIDSLLTISEKWHNSVEFIDVQKNLQNRLKNYQDFCLAVRHVLGEERACQLSDEEYERQGEALLQEALNRKEHELVIEITQGLAGRLVIPQQLLIEIYQTLDVPSDESLTERFVSALSSVGCFPELLRFHLNRIAEEERVVAGVELMLDSLSPLQEQSEVADILAALYALKEDWEAFDNIIDSAMRVTHRLPVLFKYATEHWLVTGSEDKYSAWLMRPEYLNAEELCYFSVALESSAEPFDAKLQLLQVAHWMYPNNIRAMIKLGAFLYSAGVYKEAVQCLVKAINKGAKDNFDAYFFLASSLQDAGDNKQALEYFKVALSIQPYNMKVWQSLCRLMLNVKNWSGVYDIAKFCLADDIENADYWHNLILASLKIDLADEAMGYVREALRVAPDFSAKIVKYIEKEKKYSDLIERAMSNGLASKCEDTKAIELAYVNMLMEKEEGGKGAPARNKKFQIVAASAASTVEETLLYRSVVQLDNSQHEVGLDITTSNKEGLAALYNRKLQEYSDSDYIIFCHDDIFIDDPMLYQKVEEAIGDGSAFSVCGLAGSKECAISEKNLWHWMYKGFGTNAPKPYSGAVSHYVDKQYKQHCVTNYGPTPQQCVLLDGLFLAVNVKDLMKKNVRFDDSYPSKFHFYDLDFSLECYRAGLKITTWPIQVIHASGGLSSLEDSEWNRGNEHFINKWTRALNDVDDDEYFSCPYIEGGINFYSDDKVSLCCYGDYIAKSLAASTSVLPQ